MIDEHINSMGRRCDTSNDVVNGCCRLLGNRRSSVTFACNLWRTLLPMAQTLGARAVQEAASAQFPLLEQQLRLLADNKVWRAHSANGSHYVARTNGFACQWPSALPSSRRF